MSTHAAEFITSATKRSQFPDPIGPEVAFVGRSNVGKSSLINALVGVNKLAKTSRTPGRTRLVNFFRVHRKPVGDIGFVDLPGYGYAKVSKDMRASWRPMVESYLGHRDVLRRVYILIDARRDPQDDEVDLLDWLAQLQVPATIVLTKADKLTKSKRKLAAFACKKTLSLKHTPILTSVLGRDGLAELWRSIDSSTK